MNQNARGPQIRRTRRAADTTFVFGARIVSTGLLFLAGVATARMFSTEVRGEYAMLLTVSAFVAQFANLGFPEAVVYFYRRGAADLHGIQTSILLFDGLATLALTAIGLALAPWLAAQFFPTGGVAVSWVAMACGLLAIIRRNSLALAQAEHHFLSAAVSWMIQPTVFTLWLGVLYLTNPTLQQTAIAFLVSWAAGSLYLLVPAARAFRPSSLSRDYWSSVMRFSGKSYAHVAIIQANYRLDMFIVAYLLPDLSSLAFYHIAASVTGLLWLIPDSYGVVIYPRLSGYDEERDRTRETVYALRYIFVVVLSLAVALTAVAGIAVPWAFGERYREAVALIYLLVPGVLLMAFTKILTRYLLSRNRHQWSAYCSLIGVAVDVVANVLLIPRYGVRGAAVAATLAYTVTTLGMVAAWVRLASFHREDWQQFPAREISAVRGIARSAWGRITR